MTNGFGIRNGILALVAIIVTVIATLFADRLVIERSETSAMEQRSTLRRDVDSIKVEYARRDIMETRLNNLDKSVDKLDQGQQRLNEGQEKILELLERTLRSVRK